MKKNGRLRFNIAALSALQASNYLIPLLTYPYLTRVIGVEAFGKVAYVQMIMAIFILLTDYGFSWSGVRSISANRENRLTIGVIFIASWLIQWGLLLISAICLVISVSHIEFLNINKSLFFIGFLSVIGNVLFPLWLFQGLEHMKEVAFFQVIGRLIFLLPLFIFVKGPEDASIVLLINGFSSIFIGAIAIWWLLHFKIIDWHIPRLAILKKYFFDGGGLFLSRIFISFYTGLIPIILGWVSNTVEVGFFALADKIRVAVQSVLTPISQSLFPRMSFLFQHEPLHARSLLKLSSIFIIIVSGSASVGLFLFAEWIILFLAGKEFLPAIGVLRILSFLPLIVGISNILGMQIMLPKKLNQEFNLILMSASILSLLIAWPVMKILQAEGAALVLLISEIFVSSVMAIVLLKKFALD